MRTKLPLLFPIVLLFALPAIGQVKLGLKLTPVVSINRVEALDTTTSWETNATAVRFIFGPTVDIYLTESYQISTGLWYVPRRYNAFPTGASTPDVRDVQYLQLPISMKLYTDEIMLDTKVYFQLGAVGEIRLTDRDQEPSVTYLPKVDLFGANVLLSAGLEYRWGYNTIVYGGILYQRGLFNVVSGGIGGNPTYALRQDLIGLDLGLKF